MKLKNNYWFIVLVLGLTLALSACGAAETDSVEAADNEPFQNFTPVVSATGKVMPQQWATLSIPTGGIVINLRVAENDQVKEGQVLLQLSGAERLEAAVKTVELELIAAQQAYDDLFEFQETNTALVKQSIATLRDTVRDTEIRINNLKYTASQEDIEAGFATLVLAEDRLVKARNYFENFKDKPETNIKRASALTVMNQAQNAYDSALRTYNYMTGTADEIEIGKAEANLALAITQFADAERKLEQMADGPDPDTLALVEARLENAKAQVNAAQFALDDLQLKAPFSGTIGQINVRQNEWVNPGQPLIVLGDLSTLQIETTDLNEIDVARIHLDSTATVTFDSLPDQVIEAVIVQIASKSSPGAGVNYTVILEMSETPENLLWDMTAYVDIQIDD